MAFSDRGLMDLFETRLAVTNNKVVNKMGTRTQAFYNLAMLHVDGDDLNDPPPDELIRALQTTPSEAEVDAGDTNDEAADWYKSCEYSTSYLPLS